MERILGELEKAGRIKRTVGKKGESKKRLRNDKEGGKSLGVGGRKIDYRLLPCTT